MTRCRDSLHKCKSCKRWRIAWMIPGNVKKRIELQWENFSRSQSTSSHSKSYLIHEIFLKHGETFLAIHVLCSLHHRHLIKEFFTLWSKCLEVQFQCRFTHGWNPRSWSFGIWFLKCSILPKTDSITPKVWRHREYLSQGVRNKRRDTVFLISFFHSVRKEDVRKLANSEHKDQDVHLFLETAESTDWRKSSRRRISRAVCGRITLPIRRKREQLATALDPWTTKKTSHEELAEVLAADVDSSLGIWHQFVKLAMELLKSRHQLGSAESRHAEQRTEPLRNCCDCGGWIPWNKWHWKRKRFLLPVESKMAVFERRPMKFPAWE